MWFHAQKSSLLFRNLEVSGGLTALTAVKVTVCLQAVSLQILPAVLVFKDGTYYTYSGKTDSILRSLCALTETFLKVCRNT